MAPTISVVVPIFNGISYLQAFFESLAAALPAESEVILVDDAPTEAVWEAVPDLGAQSVIQLRNDRNLGYAGAVNRGLAEAKGEVVIQLNTDLVLDRNCLVSMVDLIERREHVGVVGSKLIFPTTGTVQHVGMAIGHFTKPHIYFDLDAFHPLCCETREVQVQTGATVAMTQRVLELLGPLDTGYYNVNNDIEHCLLARRQGLRNYTCADSIAYHWTSHSGPARFAGLDAGEAMFWARWGQNAEIDLGHFVNEALEHVLNQDDSLLAADFEILDLSRGADQPLVLGCLERKWPGITQRVHCHRQTNNPADRLKLPLVLPHWVMHEPRPFIYLVDGHRELDHNRLWFQTRSQFVEDELIVDLTGAALRTSERDS